MPRTNIRVKSSRSGRLIERLDSVRNLCQQVASSGSSDQSSDEIQDFLNAAKPFLVADAFSGTEVKRHTSDSNRRYRDPFNGATGELCVYNVTDRPPRSQRIPRMHYHRQEEIVLMCEGTARVLVQSGRSGSRRDAVSQCQIQPFQSDSVASTFWVRSSMPHSIISGERSKSQGLTFFSHRPEERSVGDNKSADADVVFARTDDDASVSGAHQVGGHSSRAIRNATHNVWVFPSAGFNLAMSDMGKDVSALRIRRGLRSVDIAPQLLRDPSWLSRFENQRLAPSADDLVSLAKALGISPFEIIPYLDSPYVAGCYLNKVSGFYAGDARNELRDQLDAIGGPSARAAMPYAWKDHNNTLVLLASSPNTRALVAMTLYIGVSPNWAVYANDLGRHNARLLQSNQRLHAIEQETMLFVQEGAIRVEVSSLPHAELSPAFSVAKQVVDSEWREEVCLEAGQIGYFRSGVFPMRIMPVDESTPARVFVVKRKLPGSHIGLSVPTEFEHGAVLRQSQCLVPRSVARSSASAMAYISIESEGVEMTKQDESEADEPEGVGADRNNDKLRSFQEDLRGEEQRLLGSEIYYLAARLTQTRPRVTLSTQQIFEAEAVYESRLKAREAGQDAPDLEFLDELVVKINLAKKQERQR